MKHPIIPYVLISISVVLLGIFIYCGISNIAFRDRSVAVKGLSTRDVKADYAVWPLSYSVEADDLATIEHKLNTITSTLRSYLINKGFSDKELQSGYLSVDDQWSNGYSNKPIHRYLASTSMIVSTENVDLVVACQNCQTELLAQGIVVGCNEWALDYQFNGLNELKPQMIEEATRNARNVAQKFADDANCHLGSIRSANQGQFSIESDNYQPWVKHVRVVTSISYYLK